MPTALHSGIIIRKALGQSSWFNYTLCKSSGLDMAFGMFFHHEMGSGWLFRWDESKPNLSDRRHPSSSSSSPSSPLAMSSISTDEVSLPTILSRFSSLSNSLPEELFLALLIPLISPHKDARDHHLIVTSASPSPTSRLLQSVIPSRIKLNIDNIKFTRTQNLAYNTRWRNVPLGSS